MTFLEAIQINSQMHEGLRKKKDVLFLPAAKLLHKLHVTPFMVTSIGAGIGLASIPLLWFNYWWFVAGSVVSVLLDGVDGALARYSNTTSKAGAQFDYGVDIVIALLLFSALTWWLAFPLWVIGLNWWVALLLVNWLFGSPLKLAPNRMTLIICMIFGLPQIGLALVSTYAVVMSVKLLKMMLSRKRTPSPSQPLPPVQ